MNTLLFQVPSQYENLPQYRHIRDSRRRTFCGEITLLFFHKYIKDICFFEVNTKCISSSELKTSEFSLVLRTRENFDVFNSRHEIHLVFTEKKKQIFFFILYFLEKTNKLKKVVPLLQ